MTAMAIGAHPDDIEMMMGGTFLLLGSAGYELHYMTVADGSCGSLTLPPAEIIAIRAEESKRAARSANAVYHPPLVHDLEIFYTQPLIRKLGAIIREVKPQILLVPSPVDYMEDHTNTSRLAVTAAFCRNIPNYETDPRTQAADTNLALYHALPYGLTDQLRNTVTPHFYVNIDSVLTLKRAILSCHESQRDWLDDSQQVDDYLKSMEEASFQVGRMSGGFRTAEGWRRHSHMGFADPDFDPLFKELSQFCMEKK